MGHHDRVRNPKDKMHFCRRHAHVTLFLETSKGRAEARTGSPGLSENGAFNCAVTVATVPWSVHAERVAQAIEKPGDF